MKKIAIYIGLLSALGYAGAVFAWSDYHQIIELNEKPESPLVHIGGDRYKCVRVWGGDKYLNIVKLEKDNVSKVRCSYLHQRGPVHADLEAEEGYRIDPHGKGWYSDSISSRAYCFADWSDCVFRVTPKN